MRPLPVVSPHRRGVFTLAEALVVGWTEDALARAVGRGRIVRLRRGVYCEAGPGLTPPARHADVERARRAVAASLACAGVVVSHLAAVELHDWPVWAPRPRDCITATDNRSRVPGFHVRRTPVWDQPAAVAGFLVTRPTRTVLDVACEFGTEAGLVVADAAAARGETTRERLRLAVAAGRGRTGIANARALPDLVDPSAESPLESRSRWQCVVHDVPPPRPQTVLWDAAGRFLGRADFFCDAGVVGEVDGAGKLAEQSDRRAILRRQLGLTRAGLRVVRWGAEDLASFGGVAAWIREELAAALADRHEPEWRVAGVDTRVTGAGAG